MESHRSKSIESIYLPLYSIPPIVGSLIPVLASPDTEIPPPHLPISKIFGTPYLHKDVVRSGHKEIVEQLCVCPRACPKLNQIRPLLPGTVGASTHRLSRKRDRTAILRALRIRDGISSFQVCRIHLHTFLQYSPDPWLSHTCSGISRYRDTLPNFPHLENFRNPFSP